MSIPSYNGLQMLLDSESILPCSQPEIHPEAIVNMISEDVPKFAHPDDVAAVQAEWAQVCAEDEFLKAQQGSLASFQNFECNQTSFPTLNQFTAPVAGLPQFPPMDQSQYYLPQLPAVPQTPLEGSTWSQPEYDGGSYANGPNFDLNYYPPIVDLELWAAGDPRAYGPIQPFSPGQNAQFQMGMYTPSAEHTGYAYPGATTDTMMDTETLLPSVSDTDATIYLNDDDSLEPSSSAPDGTACTKLPKRKTRHTIKSEDDSSGSSLAQTTRKRRCLDDDEDEVKEGKFGAYRLADASAVVMAMPVHDPKPVDISSRRTHGARGNLLRTRRFGAMELDDSYSKRSAKITNELPAEMTCVRACDWTDQPCGLFVEMNKNRVAHHLLHWHGVKSADTTACKFEGCSKSEAMINLGRHIEGVHYTTSYECPYCGKRWSRSDSLDRHQQKCEPLLDSKARAKKGSRKFNLQDPKKLVYGYIVPARDAT
ncbi:hypothetical protein BDR03DRAFT_1092181 [Suillus americanus]|nr:hypothetical protein BDR03DRAFT_1092181 [Suillus americanus]